MKFLIVGDLHIKHDNSEDIDNLLQKIKNIATEFANDITIVLLGDILHTHEKVFIQCLNKALYFITECSKITMTYVIVGNHDAVNNQIFLTTSHWMNVLKDKQNIIIVDTVIKYPSLPILFVPYVYPGRFVEALDTFTTWKNEIKLIFAHQEFKGCQMGAVVSEHGDEWDENYPFVISGHIHDNQKIKNNIHYIGAPLQHTYSDGTKRILLMVDFSGDGTFKETEIPIAISRKSILHTNVDNMTTIVEEVKQLLENKEQVKIKIDIQNQTDLRNFKQSKEYKDMVEKGVVFQITNNTSMNKLPAIEEKNRNFFSVLDKLVKSTTENYEDMIDVYNEIIFEKNTINIYC